MSFSPSLSLVRLQDLKQWQGSYDNLFQQSKNKAENHVEKASLQDSFNSMNLGEWDQKQIAPMKPFEQLLEEKLAENPPTGAATKPKKPFLRKGQGLARFRMGPCNLVKKQAKKTGNYNSSTLITSTLHVWLLPHRECFLPLRKPLKFAHLLLGRRCALSSAFPLAFRSVLKQIQALRRFLD